MAFDSREYEWGDLTVIAGGKDLTGIRGIKIKRKVEREAIYAKGRFPHSIQTGNFAFEGELIVLFSELIALDNAGNGDALSLSFDVLVGYGNPSEGNLPIFKRAASVRLTDIDEDWKQGDKFQEITLPFLCLNWKNEN